MTTFLEHLAAYVDDLNGDFTAVDAADVFLGRMRTEHPDELDAWLMEHARIFVTARISGRRRSLRSRAAHNAKRRSFQEAAEAFMSGDCDLMIKQRFVIDEVGTSRVLADMTARDCRYAASEYEASSRVALAMAAFLRALAKRAGDGTIGDVMDALEVERLANSILGRGDDGRAAA